ncbi:accessory gene regulator B family protein [Desulfoscipio sp. XC116]|uniref:accessory gene regulator B family protein n=1 Tax=Desulfoscipio sp. XC116 TaxID=3144975 RepID=UPI00325BADDA
MAGISVHALGRRLGMYVANKTVNPNQAELLGYGAEIILGSILKLVVLFSIAALLKVVYEVSIQAYL